MTDIIYPLGIGSRHWDFELKYSLRSIEKHLSNVGNVYIIGEQPNFAHNCIHIPAEDSDPCKEKNIKNKIEIACNILELSDNFLFFNDDHFINKDLDANNFPNYINGSLEQLYTRCNPHGKYKLSVMNTIEKLRELGYGQHNFDCHTPIIYNKQTFLETNKKVAWEMVYYGYTVKSIYGNINKLPVTHFRDLKLNEHKDVEGLRIEVGNNPVFSAGDTGLSGGDLKRFIEELYPLKSKYER